jgi:prevent-host-death family protein
MTKSDPAVTIVGVHQAKTNLSRLLRLVESGAEVQITRGAAPIARLIAIEMPHRRSLGLYRNRIVVPDDFDQTDDEIVDSFYA